MAQKEGIRHKKPLEYSAAALARLFTNSAPLYGGGFPDPGKTVAAAAELCQRDDALALRTTRRTRLWVGRVKMKAYPEKEAMLR